MGDSNSTRFMVAAAKQVFVSSAMLIVQILVFAISAGGIADIRPWLFFGTAFVHYVVSIAVQYKVNPQLLVRRLKRKRAGSKWWDEAFGGSAIHRSLFHKS